MHKRSSDADGNRVRRSAAQGRALVERWRRSGASVSEFCRRQAVKEHVLRYWVSRETRSSKPAARARSEFFVVPAPEMSPKMASAAPSSMAMGASSAFIVVLPAATAELLLRTLRGLLQEGQA